MILTVAAAGLALAGSQLKSVSMAASVTLAALAAATLAGAGLLRAQQDVEQTRRWTKARAIAEAMKADVYAFLAESESDQHADQQADRHADRESDLEDQVRRLETGADDLQAYTQGVQPKARPLPEVRDVETYLDVRVRGSQLTNYYEPKAARLRQRMRWAKAIEITLTLAAAALAALAVVSADVAAWAAVLTTGVGAVSAYAASERYEFLWIEYTHAASELRRLLDRRTSAADGRELSGMDLVRECERVIAVQNEAWMAKWGEKRA